jgi:hypothetical protein
VTDLNDLSGSRDDGFCPDTELYHGGLFGLVRARIIPLFLEKTVPLSLEARQSLLPGFS